MLGLASCLGATALTGEAMTANLDTDLEAKFAAARDALGRHDLVVLHVKGADIAAHDRRPDLKLEFLERLDRLLGQLIDATAGQGAPLRVAVAADHATLSEVGQHAADPVPVVIWGTGVEPDEVQAFDEQSAAGGALHASRSSSCSPASSTCRDGATGAGRGRRSPPVSSSTPCRFSAGRP